MAETTGIGWADHTVNPWMGCQRVSPGCEHCYAETLVTGRMQLPVWGPPKTTERQRTKGAWTAVPRWDRAARREGVRRKLFCASLADVFEDHPQVAPWRAEILALLERCTNLDVQLLTKRPQNIMAMVPPHWHTAWPAHVWIGTTVEDQRRADERIPHLLRVPARVRFLSCEPLLEAVDLSRWLPCGACQGEGESAGECNGCGGWGAYDGEPCGACNETGECPRCAGRRGAVVWVIVGGESGPGARPFDLAWARSIVEQCAEAGVAVFVKQLGARPEEEVEAPHRAGLPYRALRLRDRAGADPAEWPEDLRVQQFPTTGETCAGMLPGFGGSRG